MAFPIDRSSYRRLPGDWTGFVFVADIDRTYLDTRFSSFRGMARIALEGAREKRDIDGMAALLREIRFGPGPQSQHSPLYFISASPRQLRPVIERKLALDEIDFDGTTFKDWGGVIRRARWSRLREQIGYKLTALLTQRLEIPPGAEEILLGDDLEADPLVYALYADILAGRLLGAQLQALLVAHGVAAEDAEVICERADSVRSDGSPMGVRRAFIRLERHDDPIALVGYAPGIVACHSALQSAAVLWQMGCIAIDGVARVGADLIRRGMSEPALLAQLRDLVVRALLERNEAEQLNWKLREADVVGLELDGDPSVVAAWAAAANGSAAGMWTPEHVRERVRDGMLEGG